jgi:hypothetical protein
MMAYKICPRCFIGHPADEVCRTPECQQATKSQTYARDLIEGNLHIARTLLAEGNTEENWAEVIKELERELVQVIAAKSAAAFRQ